ncbi:MAG: 3-isopropylmalate dehydratase large subunit [Acidobacteria bacterium]|nr:MAG: 3-isopropylmalate dehydratase large subunit [Acidobacteriota bacterium]REK09256.1 MAG: 3-isopropylmalate dehydratase large subunit [Acidobacteriota bacterium]
MSSAPRTLLDKIWDRHLVRRAQGGLPATLYIDLHLVHEVTSPQAFAELDARGLRVRRPDRTLATMDHSTPTEPGLDLDRFRVIDAQCANQLEALRRNCAQHGVPLIDWGDERRGIVHVMGPEQGATQPGMTIVCGDSHTSTHGAFGALAFGIGTSEVGHVLATQCLLQHRPETFEVRVDGALQEGVAAKDVVLAIIHRLGIDGGTGCVFEFTGSVIRSLDMEGRMTICNMSIEGGARAGMVAPDEVTLAWLEGRPLAPRGERWEEACELWRSLPSDEGARYDHGVVLDGAAIEPMITYGTNPGMSVPIGGAIPSADQIPEGSRPSFDKALRYMGLEAGQPLRGQKIDVVFVGSCTNSRLADLRAAAAVLRGRKVASGVRMLVVPGSQQVKRQAEEEGLAEVFRQAGADWREAGCSMCLAMNGDRLEPGQYAVSTTNRNFEGRQGSGGRTFLASPQVAAASALTGRITDAREVTS